MQFHAFGNTVVFTVSPPTTTGGAPLPSFTRSSFYAIPIGHFCNYQNLTHFVSMGSAHTGTRFISTAYPAPRSTQAMNCATTTKQQGAPITGSGTATTFATPMAPSTPAIRLRGGAVHDRVSGSRGYDVPYVYWVTHAALGTGPGTVLPGGGPGRTYISQGGTGRVSGFAGIYPRPGGQQFGGTMRLLGRVRSTGFLFSGIGDGMFGASIDWRFEHAGASARGYDNRTSMGLGTVQLVSPHLVNWIGLDCPSAGCAPRSETTAGIAILRLQFVPEPSSWLILATGICFLVLLYRGKSRIRAEPR